MTDFNDFAAVAKDILFNYGADVIIAEHTRSGDLGLDKAITALVSLHEAVLRQAEKDARIDELTRVSNHLSADSKDRFIDQDVYLWMWEVEYENLNPDQSALHSERQAGTGKE